MINETIPKLAPSYTEMVNEIGLHLKDRKGLFMKRVLLVAIPGLLLGLVSYYAESAKNSLGNDVAFTVFLFAMIFVILVAYLILNNIFYLEQLIWVDSYHDGKNLDSASSWRIARRLFFSSIIFSLKIALQYYLPPLVFVVLGSVVAIYLSSASEIAIFGSIGLFIALLIYYYYLNIKLRYVWFLFLDYYGDSTADIFGELNKLNNYAGSTTFKKALVTTIGTDSVHALTNITISSLAKSAVLLGKFGGVLGPLLGVYGKEATRQLRGFALIVVYYMLYRYAREGMYGKSQIVNERIYELDR